MAISLPVVLFVIVSSEWHFERDQTVIHCLFDGDEQSLMLLLTDTSFRVAQNLEMKRKNFKLEK